MQVTESQRGSYWGRASDEPRDGDALATGLGWFSIGLGLAEVAAPGKVAELIGVRDEEKTRRLLQIYGLREIAAGVGILLQPRPAGWIWGRVAGDVLDLGTLATALKSETTDRNRAAIATAAVLGVTALDVICGQRLSQSNGADDREAGGSIRVAKAVSINRSPEELYRYWRNFENLPRFMRHLEAVHTMDDRRSHWKAKAPAGTTVEWEAEIVDDQPNGAISWRSLPDSDIENAGTVRFERATGGRGTNVHVELIYSPPGGRLGALVAKFFGEEPDKQVTDDLRAFKQIMEVGEVVQSDASIHDGPHPAQPSAERYS